MFSSAFLCLCPACRFLPKQYIFSPPSVSCGRSGQLHFTRTTSPLLPHLSCPSFASLKLSVTWPGQGEEGRAGPGRAAPSRVRAAPSGVRAACGAGASRYSERADMDLKSCIGVSKTIWKGKKTPKNKTGGRNPSPRRVRQRTPSVGGGRAAAGRGESRGAGGAPEVELIFRRITPVPGGPSCSRRSSPQFPGR